MDNKRTIENLNNGSVEYLNSFNYDIESNRYVKRYGE